MDVSQEILEACARASHEANRAYCLALGDDSQPAWDDAPEWQRKAAYAGVRGALDGNTPEQSHEGWLALKAQDGWRYGPVKDPEKKKHPCFVPYAELPAAQRRKDLIFVTVVRVIAEACGGASGFGPDMIPQITEDDRKRFLAFLDANAEVVSTWPEWKQRAFQVVVKDGER